MSTRFTTTTPNDGQSRASETEMIANMLLKAAQQVQATHATSGTITDRNSVGTLTYTYSPTASA